MGYYEQNLMTEDQDLLNRLTACVAEEVDTKGQHPRTWLDKHIWGIIVTPGWRDTYSYAIQNNVDRPGRDESVITDAMILSAVQSYKNQEVEEPTEDE